MRVPTVAASLVVALLSLVPRATAAVEVSRTIPAIYVETLASRLTTPIQAFAVQNLVVTDDDNLVHILSERLQYVTDTGGRFTVLHRIIEARNQKGVEELAELTVGFRKTEQKLHLVEAYTRQADGSIMPIGADAAFVKEPDKDSDASLYTDVAELVLVFPGVKPGATVHYTVVLEEPQTRIPGELTSTLYRAGYYPYGTIREVVDLPESWSNRLKVSHVGGTPPPATRSVPQPGRVQHEWRFHRVPALSWEPRGVPLTQRGPVTHLTTLANWGAVQRWYGSLLEDRASLDTDTKQHVDELTRGLSNPRDIARVLFEHVADDIRYTGLEFGVGAYQPHAAAQVWRHRYGDCKDKANLLRSMLHYKGIRSYITLLNGTGPGRVDWRAPGAGQFDHAILAVELGQRLMFVDPTVAKLAFGALPVGDTQREVLVLRDNRAEIVAVPKSTAGDRSFRFSLQQQVDGSLSGWLEIEAKGVLGSYYRDYYATRDSRATHLDQQQVVRGFFPSAELIDHEVRDATGPRNVSKTRAYFVVPAAHADDDTALFAKASHGGYLPSITQDGERQGAYLVRPERLTVDIAYQLPAGWNVKELPKAYSARTPEVKVRAKWRARPQQLTMSLTYECQVSQVPKARFAVFRNALAPLNTWLERPIALVRGPAPAPAEEDKELVDFPLMPSGQGQLALARQNYPLETRIEQRRRALEKIRMWFPQDVATVAETQIEEARIAAQRGDHAEAVAIIRKVLSEKRDKLPQQTIGWGEYLLAYNLHQAGAAEEAFEVALRVGRRDGLSAYRRGWAMELAAELALELAREDTIAVAFEGMQHGGESAAHLARTALQRAIVLGDAERFMVPFTRYIEGAPAEAASTWTAVSDHLGEATVGDPAQLQALLAGLDGLSAAHPNPEAAAVEVAKARSAQEARGAYSRIAAHLEQQLGRSNLAPGVLTTEEAALNDRDLIARADAELENGAIQEYLRLSTAALTRDNPDESTYGRAVWRLALLLSSADALQTAYVSALDAALALPPTDDYHFEARFLLASYQAEAGAGADAEATLQYVVDSDVSPTFTAAAYLELGKLHESRSDMQRALAAYEQLRTYPGERWAVDGVLRALWLRVEAGELNKALDLVKTLESFEEGAVAESGGAAQARSILRLAATPEAAVAYWKSSPAWWRSWRTLAEDLVGPLPLADPLVGNVFDPVGATQSAVDRGDHRAVVTILDRLIRAAQVDPDGLLAVTNTIGLLGRLDRDQQDRWLRWGLEMGHALETDDKRVQSAKAVILAVCGLDSGEVDTAADAVAEYIENVNEWQGVLGEAMSRLRVLLSSRTGKLDETGLAILRRGLETGGMADMRDQSFDILVNAQRRFGLSDAERVSIETELQRPEMTGERRTALQSRLASLASLSTQEADFTRALEQWVVDTPMPWYDYAEPATLSDARIADVDTFLGRNDEGLSPPERLKAYLLIARSPSLTLSQRVNAFGRALWTLGSTAPSWNLLESRLGAVVDEHGFPRRTRVSALWTLVYNAAASDQTAVVKRWYKHDLVRDFNKTQDTFIKDAMEVLNATGPRDGSFWVAALERPLGAIPMLLLMQDLGVMAAGGRTKEIEAILSGFESASLRPEVGKARAGTELQIGRILETANRHGAAHAARLKVGLAALVGVDKAVPVASSRDIRRYPDLLELPVQEARRHALWRITHGQVQPDDVQFWSDLVAIQGDNASRTKLAGQLVDATVAHLDDDYELSRFIFLASFWFDMDNAESWAHLMKRLKRFRGSNTYPKTTEVISYLDVWYAARRGTADDLEEKLGRMTLPFTRTMGRRLMLMSALTQQDLDALRAAIDDIPAEALAAPNIMSLSVAAFQALDRKAELRAVRRRAKKALYETVLAAWYAPTHGASMSIARTSEVLGREAPVPAAFDDYMAERIRNPAARSAYLARRAASQGDWQQTVEHATVALSRWPTFYWYHWIKGKALSELNQKNEARQFLETYVRYAHDEPEWLQAKALLKSSGLPAGQ